MSNDEWSSPNLTNCTFSNNTATDLGGGMSNVLTIPTVTNCTFFGNSAEYGGGIYNYSDGASSYPTVTNSILYGDSAPNGPKIYNVSSSPTITYCDVQGGYTGTGNIDADPMFVDTSGLYFHLQATSPCIDVGDNSAPSLPTNDFEGDDRIINSTVDMGADEYSP